MLQATGRRLFVDSRHIPANRHLEVLGVRNQSADSMTGGGIACSIICDSYDGMLSATHPAPDGAGSPVGCPKDSALRSLTLLKMTKGPGSKA